MSRRTAAAIAGQIGFSFDVPTPPVLVDQPARDTVAGALDRTLFVEAGAGSGKTDRLVSRIVALVGNGIPVDRIAAITFTEKAAAELASRIRAALAEAGDGAAAAAVDQAPIGTLHGFANRLLREHPVEAGLPPAFTVLDEVASDLAFEERWTAMLDRLLETDEGGLLVHLFDVDGIRLDGLRQAAIGFGENWDLVAARVASEAPPYAPPPLGVLLAAVEDHVTRWSDLVPAGDSSERLVDGPREAAALLRAGIVEPALAVQQLWDAAAKVPSTATRTGNRSVWRKTPAGAAGLEELRADTTALAGRLAEAQRAVRDARRLLLGAHLSTFTLESARERRALGELEFHDLLVLARDLVSTHPGVRRRVHDRYRCVLLDEFQDTDPIQLELAVRITADPDDPAHAGDWRALRPLPGRLFVVGDPKQSIYRFRRADISQYLETREGFAGEILHLTTNFRSAPEVIHWVNHVFDRLIRAEDAAQPAYVPLDPLPDRPEGTVRVVGELHPPKTPADALRRAEAASVAAGIRAAVADGWPVHERKPDGTSHARPCRLGDITVLLPARTSLPVLETELAAAGIAYRAENASLVYASDEIRTLLLALRAVDDPTDELALVATLRSALFGCSDADLFGWRTRLGRWDAHAPRPERLDDDPVADALDAIRDWADMRHWLTPAELLDRIVVERRVMELALGRPDPRDVWRRVRFVVDQARAWSEGGGAGLRNYLGWARRQASEGRYVADVVLPETDHDAVRIMTVHAAKGLEFPVVFVSGLTSRPQTRSGVGVAWPPGSWDLRTARDRASSVYDEYAPIDEQMDDAERVRLLYVACTRARDHLVVSTHRCERATTTRASPTARFTSAELLAEVSEGSAAEPLVPAQAVLPSAEPAALELAWDDAGAWLEERTRTLAAASRPAVVTATGLARDDDPGLRKDPVDLELPPWQRGRYGTAVGRAVHGVLQAVDLGTGAGLEALAADQAAAEGVADRQGLVAGLARSALQSAVVRDAAGGAPHWRELYVAAPVAGLVVEGYVDLLLRSAAGLTVVDYKTDAVRTGAELDERVVQYGRQLAAYALAIEAVSGEPVTRGVLVFCSLDGPREVDVPEWRTVVEALRAELTGA
jgi:ATP-dependent helicase/nuclease subunit A